MNRHRLFMSGCLSLLAMIAFFAFPATRAEAEAFEFNGVTYPDFVYADPTVRPCEPEIAPCDATLEIRNDHGLPFYADIAADSLYFRPGERTSIMNFPSVAVEGNLIHLNFTEASFYLSGGSRKFGPFKSPVPVNARFPPGMINTGLAAEEVLPGTTVYVLRGYNYPEKEGVPVVLKPGYQNVTLPSFGQDMTRTGLSRGKRALLGLINDERERNGAVRLRAAPALNIAGQFYADWTCNYGERKISPGGAWHDQNGTPKTRAIDSGWPNSFVGENGVLWGLSLPEQAFESWMGSPPHRKGMLDPEDRFAGVGYSRKCGTATLETSPLPYNMTADQVPATDDTGDSSLARYDSGGNGGSNINRKHRFRPRVKIKHRRARKPVVRVFTGRTTGRTKIKYRGRRVAQGTRHNFKIRVRKHGRIRIRFKAFTGSKVRSGVTWRCLRSRKGRTRITRC